LAWVSGGKVDRLSSQPARATVPAMGPKRIATTSSSAAMLMISGGAKPASRFSMSA
jgi:hypothetical protein